MVLGEVRLINLVVILLSVLLQIAAAGFAIRINRIAGRRLVWLLLSGALVLMAVRRLMVLQDLVKRGISDHFVTYELVGLLISAMLLAGMILIQDLFRSKAEEALVLARMAAQGPKRDPVF